MFATKQKNDESSKKCFQTFDKKDRQSKAAKSSLLNDKNIIFRVLLLILFPASCYAFLNAISVKDKTCHVNLVIMFYHPDQMIDSVSPILTVHHWYIYKTSDKRRYCVPITCIVRKDNEESLAVIFKSTKFKKYPLGKEFMRETVWQTCCRDYNHCAST